MADTLKVSLSNTHSNIEHPDCRPGKEAHLRVIRLTTQDELARLPRQVPLLQLEGHCSHVEVETASMLTIESSRTVSAVHVMRAHNRPTRSLARWGLVSLHVTACTEGSALVGT